jgi:hypothetical protein
MSKTGVSWKLDRIRRRGYLRTPPSKGQRRVRPFVAFLALWIVASIVSRPSTSSTGSSPLLQGANVDQNVLSIFERACRDCHSDTTRYLWYSYVAPVSWWTEYHVASGRRHLNFSRWDTYPLLRRERLLSSIANQVKDREMPLSSYTLIHRDARLSASDITAIFQWTQAERVRLIAENTGRP